MNTSACGNDKSFAGESNLILMLKTLAQNECVLSARLDVKVRGPVHARPETDGALPVRA